MTSDYQSGASAMREMAAAIGENMAKTLRNGGAINAVREYAASVRTLPLPADPVSSDYQRGASDMRRFRHKKRGTTYKVIGVGQIQSDVPLTDSEYVVIYQSEADGHFWARRMSEFEDGRFEELPADPASSEGEAKLPPDLEIAEFKPCRLDLSDSGMTQWAFEDVANVANPAFPGVYHFIDEIRAMDDGRLVGIQFWGPPPKPSAVPDRSEEEDAREDALYLDDLKRRLSDAFVQRDQALEGLTKLNAAIRARDAEIATLRNETTERDVMLAIALVGEREASAEVATLRAALEKADEFITNGIELGFIRMPDESTPDSAHETPKLIRAALAAIKQAEGK